MTELFQVSANNISLYLKNFYEDKKLEEIATAEEFSVVRLEGERQVRRNLKHYMSLKEEAPLPPETQNIL